MKAMCNVLGRFVFFSAPHPGAVVMDLALQPIQGSTGCLGHLLLQGLHLTRVEQRIVALHRRENSGVQEGPCFDGGVRPRAARSCQCPFNYKVMDSPTLGLSSPSAFAGTVMIVKVELMRRAHL